MTTSQPEMGSPCPTHNTNRPESVEENITPLSKGTHDSIKLVLLGQTGTGKSACGNTILGKKKFKSRASAVPVTKECQMEEFDIFDKHVTVIDTPDFFDEEMQTQSQLHAEKYRELCQSGGSCVYLLVMEVGRFTDGEREILDKLEKALVLKKDKTIILFTRGDSLKCDQMTVQDFVNGMDPVLKNTVSQCGERFHVFENSKSDEKQVKDLMKMVHTLLYGHSQGLEDSEAQGGSTGCGSTGCVEEVLVVWRKYYYWWFWYICLCVFVVVVVVVLVVVCQRSPENSTQNNSTRSGRPAFNTTASITATLNTTASITATLNTTASITAKLNTTASITATLNTTASIIAKLNTTASITATLNTTASTLPLPLQPH